MTKAARYILPFMVVLTSTVAALGDPASKDPATVTNPPDVAAALRSLSGLPHPGKLWINDLSAFTASHPGLWIVGRCVHPCLSRHEGEESARNDAADALREILVDRLNLGVADKLWLRDLLFDDLQTGSLVSDELAERFDRPYGTVWTDTILLDASNAKLQPLLNRYQTELQARRRRAHAVRLSALGLMASAWMGCLLLNTITKGYFTLRLRLFAGLATVLSLWVLLGGP